MVPSLLQTNVAGHSNAAPNRPSLQPVQPTTMRCRPLCNLREDGARREGTRREVRAEPSRNTGLAGPQGPSSAPLPSALSSPCRRLASKDHLPPLLLS
jgi:hypothetical protein